MEVNLQFSLCFPLYLRAIFLVQALQGAYIWRGDLTEGFLRYRFGGLIFGKAYKWRGLFSEFYGKFQVRERLVVGILQAKVAPSHIGANHLLCSEKRDGDSGDSIALHSEIKEIKKIIIKKTDHL